MPKFKETRDLFEAAAQVLLWCFFLGYVFLLIWFVAFLLAGDLLYRLNGPLFGVTPHEMNLMHFYGIVFVKCCVLVLFLIPCVAIRLVLRRRTA